MPIKGGQSSHEMLHQFQKTVPAAVIDPGEKKQKSGSRLADLPLLGVVILETSSRRLSLPLFENIIQSGVDRCLC